MHAIVRCGRGQWYVSTVFGRYCKVTATEEYQIYQDEVHNLYYLVLNEEKNKLVRQYVFDKNSIYLDPSVLIVEGDDSDWIVDEEFHGCVDFLKEYEQENMEDCIPKEILEKCIQVDSEYHYNEYPEISNQKDIDDLMSAAGGFHDAFIDKLEQKEDGALYVLFDGVWGCTIEMWFSGNVSYSTDSRNQEEDDPYWFSSTMLMEDGYIYFVDQGNMEVAQINNTYCWFKAKKVKYHVIPNKD